MAERRLLVAGGSGFIAGHVVLRLLEEGWSVRTTVRWRRREAEVRATLTAGMARGDALELVEADLLEDAGWDAAVAGTDAVLHVASPVLTGRVRHEDDVVRPAREGTLRVLRAARDAGVRRVVLTSAFHAVGFGQPHDHGPFTEADWSPLDSRGVDAYGRSKILAERAAWDLVEHDGRGMELVVLLPVAVMGPVLGAEVSGSNALIRDLLNGALPGLPDLAIPIVDVRDVAAAHAAAVTVPGAAGRRVLVASGEPAVALRDVATLLRGSLGAGARKVPTRRLPGLLVRAAARFDPSMRPIAADLGFVKQVDITRLRTELGVSPRPAREAVLAAGESLLARGLAGRT